MRHKDRKASGFATTPSPKLREDNDIVANAVQGRGGNINITTQGIYGLTYRDALTSLSDITASSEFGVSGTVEINTPDVDPSQGLANLPAELVDASGLIATGCAPSGENEFIITGRGGLPPSPSDTLSGEAVLADWATLDPGVENRSSAAPSSNPIGESAPTQIVEAQGWVIGSKGEVILTATAPTVTPHIPWLTPSNCHVPQNAP